MQKSTVYIKILENSRWGKTMETENRSVALGGLGWGCRQTAEDQEGTCGSDRSDLQLGCGGAHN